MGVVFQAGDNADAFVSERNQIVHHGFGGGAVIDTNGRAGGVFAATGIHAGNIGRNVVLAFFRAGAQLHYAIGQAGFYAADVLHFALGGAAGIAQQHGITFLLGAVFQGANKKRVEGVGYIGHQHDYRVGAR